MKWLIILVLLNTEDVRVICQRLLQLVLHVEWKFWYNSEKLTNHIWAAGNFEPVLIYLSL